MVFWFLGFWEENEKKNEGKYEKVSRKEEHKERLWADERERDADIEKLNHRVIEEKS